MLHLVSQASQGQNNNAPRRRNDEQRQGTMLLSQLVSSLRDRENQDTDDEDNIF